MSPEKNPQTQEELPSKRKLLTASGIALLIATVILVTAVLPAEYGIDPLGAGAALGLLSLSTAASGPEIALPTPSEAAAATPVQEGPIAHYAAEYKVDTTEFVLGPYEYIEYKYHLERGASMLFTWTASSNVIHDMHGEHDGGPSGVAVDFDKRSKRQDHGTFTAPFSGIHGWYWENPGAETITVKLTTAGFYTSAVEIHSDHTRRAHQLTALGADTASRKIAPAAPVP
jgi:hypothetical protein